jgi:hypothetical protein
MRLNEEGATHAHQGSSNASAVGVLVNYGNSERKEERGGDVKRTKVEVLGSVGVGLTDKCAGGAGSVAFSMGFPQ